MGFRVTAQSAKHLYELPRSLSGLSGVFRVLPCLSGVFRVPLPSVVFCSKRRLGASEDSTAPTRRRSVEAGVSETCSSFGRVDVYKLPRDSSHAAEVYAKTEGAEV
jgi:hypothetical protein